LEVNPITLSEQGVSHFVRKKHDLIIVDTSGRHKQEDDLLTEMKLISEAIKPTLVYYVMDSHIGQAATAQAEAFSSVVDIGAVILTKMDGNAKGGGALAAVAATKAPVKFIGVGEYDKDLLLFQPREFVHELLGGVSFSSLFESLGSGMKTDAGQKCFKNLSEGKFTYHDLKHQMSMMSGMDITKIAKTFAPMIGKDLEVKEDIDGQAQLKIFKINNIINSMSKKESDCIKHLDINGKRVKQLAMGSGTTIVDVQSVIKARETMASTVGNIFGMMNGKTKNNPMAQMIQGISKSPQFSSMMENMTRGGGFPGMGGGMPDLSNLGGIMGDMMKNMGGAGFGGFGPAGKQTPKFPPTGNMGPKKAKAQTKYIHPKK